MLYSIDIETTGLYYYQGARIFSVAYGDLKGNTYIKRMDINKKTNIKLVKSLFSRNTMILHNSIFDLLFLWKEFGINLDKIKFHDTMIMSRLLRNTALSHSLDDLCYELCGYEKDYDALVKKYGLNYQDVPVNIMNEYQRRDIERTSLLFCTFYPYIKKDKDLLEDYDNEIETIRTTLKMQDRGIKLNKKKAINKIFSMENELFDCTEKIKKLTGHRVNLSSGKQLKTLLYDVLNLPVLGTTKTGEPSTNKQTAFELREMYQKKKNKRIFKILDTLAKYRTLEHGLGMIKSYLKFSTEENIIHPYINTNQASTGRQSCKDPNLMAVSKKENHFNPHALPLRELFICRKDHRIYLVDYAGIELRLIVEVSQDKEMIKILKEGKNPHEEAGKVFFPKKFKNKKESKDLYNMTKNTHFAIPYGASPLKIANSLGVSTEEGRKAYYRYAERFPAIANLSRTIAHKAKEQGYIRTLFGRKLKIKNNKYYTAINYCIQGTGAQLLKYAENRIQKYLDGKQIKMLIPIHDELIFEMPKKYLFKEKKYINKISAMMTSFTEFKVPLEVEWSYTDTNWNDKEDLNVNCL